MGGRGRREAVFVDSVPRLSHDFPHAVRAGDLVFVGQQVGIPPGGSRPARGYPDLPPPVASELTSGRFAWDSWAGPVRAQCWQMLEHHRSVLEAAGSSLGELLRINMWMVDFSQLPVLMPVRSAPFRPETPPPITNIGTRELTFPTGLVQASSVAAVPRAGGHREELQAPGVSQDVGDYMVAARYGDHAFAAGMIAAHNDDRASVTSLSDLGERGGRLADVIGRGGRAVREVRETIAVQTHFVMQDIGAFLDAHGFSTENVARLTVYLKQWSDLPTWWQVFTELWPGDTLPPLTVVGCTQLGAPEFEIEIEVTLFGTAESGKRSEPSRAEGEVFEGSASAARAGELVHVGGQLGLLPGGRLAHDPLEVPARRHETGGGGAFSGSMGGAARYGVLIAQVLASLDNVDRSLGGFGLALDDLVHLNVFVRDVAAAHLIEAVLAEQLTAAPPALSVVEVPWLPIRQAEVMLDGVALLS